MADTQITFRLDAGVRDEITNLVEEKKYRNQTDFIVRAIIEKLERESVDPDQVMVAKFIEALRTNSDVKAAFDQAVCDARNRTA